MLAPVHALTCIVLSQSVNVRLSTVPNHFDFNVFFILRTEYIYALTWRHNISRIFVFTFLDSKVGDKIIQSEWNERIARSLFLI
jgi:hypothetical protein